MISFVLGFWQQLDERDLVLQMQKPELRNSSAHDHITHKWQGQDWNSGLSDARNCSLRLLLIFAMEMVIMISLFTHHFLPRL